MRRLPLHVRGIALLGAGALAVHELRLLAACGRHAEACGDGPAYLAYAGPIVAALLACALGLLIAEIVRPSRAVAARQVSFTARWALCAGALAAIYTVQEAVEGAVSPEHLSGAAAVVGAGGWWGLLFAPLVGALVALALKGADAVVELARLRPRVRPPIARPLAALTLRPASLVVPAALFAGPLGARAPPAPLA